VINVFLMNVKMISNECVDSFSDECVSSINEGETDELVFLMNVKLVNMKLSYFVELIEMYFV
jgi:hypothetical protein